jgi:hypothetical protein
MYTFQSIIKKLALSAFMVLFASWGFFAHKHINHQAVFSLPVELMPFYKCNIDYLTEHAVDPDKRRYAVKTEACKHYIDLDHYPEILANSNPVSYFEAKEAYTEDSLNKHGTLPWNILQNMKYLEQAFSEQNEELILKYSADLGHYIGDAHVPLHTTSNYNGQFTNQHGIHGLWESRIPELYFQHYNLWIGNAQYLEAPEDSIWKCIFESHALVQRVLAAEIQASSIVSERKKYSVHYKNGNPVKSYSPVFCKHYQALLENSIETRFRKSIRMVADCWYTCWVNAGKPPLRKEKISPDLLQVKPSEIRASEECIH